MGKSVKKHWLIFAGLGVGAYLLFFRKGGIGKPMVKKHH